MKKYVLFIKIIFKRRIFIISDFRIKILGEDISNIFFAFLLPKKKLKFRLLNKSYMQKITAEKFVISISTNYYISD